MATKIEFYERLKEHIPDEAARLIAEEVNVEDELITKDYLHGELQSLRSDMFRWMLAFFAPLWLGVFGTLAAILIRG